MMRPNLYNRFIRPISLDTDLAEREIVLNYLLSGIFVLSLIAFLVTLSGPILSKEAAHPERLVINLATTLFILGLYFVARFRGQYKPVAAMLTLMIAAFGCLVALQWGLLDPYSAVLLSLAVVMAGILIGARYSLYMTCGVLAALAYLQHGQSAGTLHADTSWQSLGPGLGDVIGISAILFVVALVSWLFNRQMELSLKRARRSESALQKQKASLEVQVQRRTQQLEAARMEQMRELYRFAELGRLSTALFHDLANHLANISLDIEGLNAKEGSDIMRRIRGNVRHIDGVVQRVRQQIQGKSSSEVFSVLEEINGIIEILSFDAGRAGVSVMLEPGNVRTTLLYKGDLTRFRQILMNITLNAVEAYGGRRSLDKERSVLIRLGRVKTSLTIEVTDHGSVIPEDRLQKIFEPFYTTKPKGVGIGLFIVKQVVENDFGGSIKVASDREQGTTFSVVLPKSHYVRPARG